jgi:fermentation-respiration switch protein FrsA (DUF1100 family)
MSIMDNEEPKPAAADIVEHSVEIAATPATAESTVPSTEPKKPRNWIRLIVRSLAIYILVPYVVIIALFAFAQRSLIYRPTKAESLSAKSVNEPRVQIADVEIPVDANLTLHGWHYRSRQFAARNRGIVVLYFGGNAGCRADRVSDCRDFTDLGCDVVLVDYRGYGDNQGSPSETALAEDANRVWTHATDSLQFAPERIVLFGESLGGAVAIRLAAEKSAAGQPPAALILNSTFSSLAETAAWHYPALPIGICLLDRFPSISRIGDVRCPIIQFHTTDDEVVPFEQGKNLFDAAPKESSNGIPKKFVKVQGGHHNYIEVTQMQSAIVELLDGL